MQTWIIFALLSAIFAALVAIFGKLGVQKIDPTLSTTVRAIIMAVFLVLTSALFGKIKLLGTISGRPLMYIVLSGIAGALSWLFYFFALRTGSAAGVAALDRLSVVFVLIFAILLLGEHLTWKSGSGAVLITFGAILMTLK